MEPYKWLIVIETTREENACFKFLIVHNTSNLPLPHFQNTMTLKTTFQIEQLNDMSKLLKTNVKLQYDSDWMSLVLIKDSFEVLNIF